MLKKRHVHVGVLGQADALADDDTVEHAVVGDLPEYLWAGDARIRDIIAGLVCRHSVGRTRGHAVRAASAAGSTLRGCSSATGMC